MPTRRPDEKRAAFINRCMSDDKMRRQFAGREQRLAVCIKYADE